MPVSTCRPAGSGGPGQARRRSSTARDPGAVPTPSRSASTREPPARAVSTPEPRLVHEPGHPRHGRRPAWPSTCAYRRRRATQPGASTAASVDLPAPLRPSSARTSPWSARTGRRARREVRAEPAQQPRRHAAAGPRIGRPCPRTVLLSGYTRAYERNILALRWTVALRAGRCRRQGKDPALFARLPSVGPGHPRPPEYARRSIPMTSTLQACGGCRRTAGATLAL